MQAIEREVAPRGAEVVIEPRLSAGAGEPEAWEGIRKLLVAVHKGGVSRETLELTHLRASQINGCSACIESAIRGIRKAGEPDDRLHAVAAWRHSSRFTAAERAALGLTEAMTRLADQPGDAVPDNVWQRATEHYDQRALGALVLHIALTNLFNRLNVTTRQPPGDW